MCIYLNGNANMNSSLPPGIPGRTPALLCISLGSLALLGCQAVKYCRRGKRAYCTALVVLFVWLVPTLYHAAKCKSATCNVQLGIRWCQLFRPGSLRPNGASDQRAPPTKGRLRDADAREPLRPLDHLDGTEYRSHFTPSPAAAPLPPPPTRATCQGRPE